MSKSFERLSKGLARTLGVSTEELLKSFYPATESEIEEIIEFRKSYFPNGLKWNDLDYLKWRYSFTDDDAGSHGRYWILKINDEILGAIGMESFQLMLNGKVTPACHPLDLMTKPELNGVGVGAWLGFAVKEKSPIVFVVGASDQAKSLIRKSFYSLPSCIEWKLPISIKGSLKRRLKVPGLANVLAYVCDGYNSLARTIRFKFIGAGKTTVRKLDKFTVVVDELANRFELATNYRFRSAEYLNWRFINNPCTNYTALGLYKDEKLVAYSIFHVKFSDENNQNEVKIDDIFWDNGNCNHYGAVLAKKMIIATVKHAVNNSNAKLIHLAVYSETFSSILNSLGFISRGAGSICAVYAEDVQVFKNLQNEKSWYITDGDAHAEG